MKLNMVVLHIHFTLVLVFKSSTGLANLLSEHPQQMPSLKMFNGLSC